MKKGSIVSCIKDITDPVILAVLNAHGIKEVPKKGHKYKAEVVFSCGCGNPEHLLIALKEFPGIAWPAIYFEEVEPPFDVDKLINAALCTM